MGDATAPLADKLPYPRKHRVIPIERNPLRARRCFSRRKPRKPNAGFAVARNGEWPAKKNVSPARRPAPSINRILF
jgi:hypothetical protein